MEGTITIAMSYTDKDGLKKSTDIKIPFSSKKVFLRNLVNVRLDGYTLTVDDCMRAIIAVYGQFITNEEEVYRKYFLEFSRESEIENFF